MSEIPARHRFDSLAQEAFLNLWRTYDRLHELEETLFGPYGLTPQQYNALRLLRAAHPERVPTLALAGRLVTRAPDITRLVDKLVENGWVARRRPQKNRRVVELGITDRGLKLLEQLDPAVRACHQRQLGHLSAAELRSLVELLETARRPHENATGDWGENLTAPPAAGGAPSTGQHAPRA